MEYNVSVVGFGDNVVDIYTHSNKQYPGGNCVNFAVYAKMFGAKRSAYMGYFGTDVNADHVIEALHNEKIETVKCKKISGENGYSRCKLENGDRVFLDYNEGGVRSRHIYELDEFEDSGFDSYNEYTEDRDSGESISVDDAAQIWASHGKDEDYTFGYSEEELEDAL